MAGTPLWKPWNPAAPRARVEKICCWIFFFALSVPLKLRIWILSIGSTSNSGKWRFSLGSPNLKIGISSWWWLLLGVPKIQYLNWSKQRNISRISWRNGRHWVTRKKISMNWREGTNMKQDELILYGLTGLIRFDRKLRGLDICLTIIPPNTNPTASVIHPTYGQSIWHRPTPKLG